MRRRKMSETMYRASQCCRVLGNPTAYSLLRSLGAERRTPSSLSRELGVSLSAVSRTLRHLRQVHLVRYETKGMEKVYWVKDGAVFRVLASLEQLVERMRVKLA